MPLSRGRDSGKRTFLLKDESRGAIRVNSLMALITRGATDHLPLYRTLASRHNGATEAAENGAPQYSLAKPAVFYRQATEKPVIAFWVFRCAPDLWALTRKEA